MYPISIEVTIPLSTTALCLIGLGTSFVLVALIVAVVGLYGEVRRITGA
jgi:hypothetical protein